MSSFLLVRVVSFLCCPLLCFQPDRGQNFPFFLLLDPVDPSPSLFSLYTFSICPVITRGCLMSLFLHLFVQMFSYLYEISLLIFQLQWLRCIGKISRRYLSTNGSLGPLWKYSFSDSVLDSHHVLQFIASFSPLVLNIGSIFLFCNPNASSRPFIPSISMLLSSGEAEDRS